MADDSTTTTATQVLTPEAVRIRELEETVAKLTQKLKKANHSDPERLKEYNKTHPDKVAERKKRYNEKNKDAILARRREAYKLKKAQKLAEGGEEGKG